MKQLTIFIKNKMGGVRSIEKEVRSAEYEVRSKITENRNISSLRGTMLPIHRNLFINGLRLPRFATIDVTFKNQKSKIKNHKSQFKNQKSQFKNPCWCFNS